MNPDRRCLTLKKRTSVLSRLFPVQNLQKIVSNLPAPTNQDKCVNEHISRTHPQKIFSNVLIVMVLLMLVSGCAVIGKRVPAPPPRMISEQERSFAGALEYLRSGNGQQARDLLEKVCEAPSVIGVTDEALFRLAVLHLGDEGSKGAVRAQVLLERLRNEFPQSSWAQQAIPLASYLAGAKVLRDRQREMKTLKDLNLSLSRDNRELRQSLERLKQLDIELEQKIKR